VVSLGPNHSVSLGERLVSLFEVVTLNDTWSPSVMVRLLKAIFMTEELH